jgi:hypothetical protein
MFRLRVFLIVLMFLFTAGAAQIHGQAPPPIAPSAKASNLRQGNPLATEKHRRLAFLAGEWDEEVVYADAASGEEKSTGHWTARPSLGLYLTIQYGSSGPRGAYRAFGVLTYDQEQQRYRMWWFDAAAGIGEYSGDFTDSNSLVLEHEGKSEGKAFRERIRYVRVSPGEVQTIVEQSWEGGAFKPYLQTVAHRRGPASAPQPPPQK